MTSASRIALLAMGISLAACSDNSVGPSISEPQTRPERRLEGSTQDLTPADTVRFNITIDPSRQTTFSLGAGNSLTFPAGSLCDVNSSYGKKEWDEPCAKATSPLTVNVSAWIDSKGHTRVDFDQHVRFVPSDDPSRWVVITFADMEAALNPEFTVLYCPNSHGRCKDEAKKDSTLRITRDPITGKVTRRIKHFSGYNVAAGRDADSDDSFGEEMFTSTSAVTHRAAVAFAMPFRGAKRIERLIESEHAYRDSGYILASG